MQVPLEVSFRDVPKSPIIEGLIRQQAEKLEQVCDHIVSCRIAVEQPQEHQRMGNPFRVRLDVRVPPGHEIVVRREPTDGTLHDGLPAVIRQVFRSARRQLKELVQMQEGRTKSHPMQDTIGIIARVDRHLGFGFITTIDGRDIYFHRNSVLNGAFALLVPGSAVRFVEEMGEEGPQASTVQPVDRLAT